MPPTTLEFERATEEEFVVNVDTTKIVLHATTAMAESSAESSEQEEQLEHSLNGSPTVSRERYTVNNSEKVNGLKTLIIYFFLIINRLI